jgi:hypothetical protein
MAYSDQTLLIVSDTDSTKRARFSVSSVTPGQTRVVTIPDANITLGAQTDVQVFTGNGTWTKPVGAKMVHVVAISGGAGGGSGRRGAAGAVRCGGGGGGGGSEQNGVGAGGTGGAGATYDAGGGGGGASTNGANSGAGGNGAAGFVTVTTYL